MDIAMEELVPIVGKLAEQYTAYEHTSMPYEKAEQLMQAVLYCIHEAELSGQGGAVADGKVTAQQLYEVGLACVEEKARQALGLYNKVSPSFSHYGNQCLYDTMVKGLPEFFRWYDMKFCPQDTILTLDYPVLKDLSGYTGIDKIYEFLLCIQMEQAFLGMFPEGYVKGVLVRHGSQYEDMVVNLCEAVLADVAGHVLAGRPLSEGRLAEEGCQAIQCLWEQSGIEGMKRRLDSAPELFAQMGSDGCSGLPEYLSGALEDILVRIGTAAEHGMLHHLF